VYVQDVSNGRIYTMTPSTYQDSGTNFTVTLQTTRSNFGSGEIKFESKLDVIGDTTTGTLGVATSDDDYSAFTTARTIDMTLPVKRLTRLGSFYARAHRFTYTQNDDFRAQAFVPDIQAGTK